MQPEEAFVMMVFAFAAAVLGWTRASARHRKLRQMVDMAVANRLPAASILGASRGVAQQIDDRDDRLEDLENHIDQMAGQIDRLAESQEFLSRVLTSRLDERGIDTPRRVVPPPVESPTPH